MITLYTGTPGSGKSLHVAQDILRWAKKYDVLCNFPVSVDKVQYVPNYDLSPACLYTFAEDHQRQGRYREGYIKLVVDEAQILFSSRDWMGKERKRWLEFFTQHRKIGYDIVLICQMDIMIDKQIRGLVEYQVVHRKLGAMRAFPFADRLCVGIRYWYPLAKRLGADWIIGRRKLYEVYDTTAIFSALMPVQNDGRGASGLPQLGH